MSSHRCFQRYQPVHASILCSRGVAQGSPRSGGTIVTCSHLVKQWAASLTAGQRTSTPFGRGPSIHTTLDQGIQSVRGISDLQWIRARYQSFENIYIHIYTFIYIHIRCLAVILCIYIYYIYYVYYVYIYIYLLYVMIYMYVYIYTLYIYSQQNLGCKNQ